jgi:hypothetical protein
VSFLAVGARVAYGEGARQGGGGRCSPGWRGTDEGRQWWPTVGVEVLHHHEEGMKGEAPRMRVESNWRR